RVGDTWEWDGATWTERATTGPARQNMGIAYDSARNRTVVFGGAGPLGDTWEWDGATWTERATTGPAPRVDPAMVYDSARGRRVMFGGYTPAGGSFGTLFGDTWEWDGNTWTQRTNVGSPGVRTNHPMAYDSVTGKTVLFGGEVTFSP